MATRWHWPPENSWGRLSAARVGSMPTSSNRRSTACHCSASVAALQMASGSRTAVAQRAAGVEGGDRVLEDHLHPRAGGAHRLSCRGAVRSRPRTAPSPPTAGAAASRHGQSTSCRSRTRRRGRASRPTHVEADPGDRADDQPGAPERELDDEVLGAQHRVVVGRAQMGVAGARPLAGARVARAFHRHDRDIGYSGEPTGYQQAKWWSGVAAGTSGGTSAWQRSRA